MKTKIQITTFLLILLALNFGCPSLQSATLVHYWPFDEASGSIVASNRISINPAILVNADPDTVWINSGLPAQLPNSTGAISLDGVDDYLNLGVLGLRGSATLSMWLNLNSTFIGDMRLVSSLTQVSTYEGLLRFDSLASGNIQVLSSVPSVWGASWQTVAPMTSVTAGEWIHLVVVYTHGTATLYLNGERQGGNYSGFQFNQSELGLGAKFNNAGNTFSGAIDDVSIWDGPLNTNSIAQLAAGVSPTNVVDVPVPAPAAQLIHYFPLDEAPGATTVPNSGSGGNTGSLVGFEASTAWTNTAPSQLASSVGSLSFDGVDDYVDFGNIGVFGSAAVSLWIKPITNNADIRIYAQTAGPTTTPGLIGFVGTGGLQVYNSASTIRIAPDNSIPTNEWTHLVVSYDNGYATAYINGVPQITTRAVFSFASANFGLGANFNLAFGRKFGGLIDDVSIWNGGLSLAAIQQLASGVSPLAITDTPQDLPPVALSVSIPDAPTGQLTQYFPLEGTGTTTDALNEVADGNTGILVNYAPSQKHWEAEGLSPRLASRSTAALFLDGTNDYLNAGNVGLSGNGTISLWLKPTTVAGDRRLYNPLTGVTSQQGGVSIANGVVQATTGALYAPAGTIVTNEWQHIAIAYRDGIATLYLDGVEKNTVTTAFQFNGPALGFGARYVNSFGQTASGLMDDISIWDRALSPDSIEQLANGVSPQLIVDSPKQLVLTWPAFPGGAYEVESSTSLNGPWIRLTAPSTLSGTTLQLLVPVSSSASFFRLRQQ